MVAALVALGLAFAQGAVFVAGLVAMGFVGAIWTLLASSIAAEFGQGAFGRAFGLISFLPPFGTLFAPVLAWTQERTGSYADGLIGVGLLSLLGAVLALFLRPQPHERPR
jgi:MFS-type transporter involved in bile tolerance (Atg22 family)